MKELYTTEEETELRDEILAAIPRVIDVLGGSLDEMFWTVLRDIQVFAQKSFGSISGAAHPHLAGAFIGGALISNLAYLGKVVNKNKVESLSEVLENCRTHFGDKYCYLEYDGSLTEEHQKALEHYFQQDLDNLGRGYLDVKITGHPDNYRLSYMFSKKITDILKSNNSYEEVIANLNLNDKKDVAVKVQLDKMIPEADRKKPISQVRREFLGKLKELNQTKVSDVGKVAFDFAGDLSFQFWLVFFVSDMLYDNADTNQWSMTSQISTLAIALGISLVKFGAKIGSYIRNRKAAKEKEKQFEIKSQASVEDKSLQHKQYTALTIRMNDKHNKDKLEHQKLPDDIQITEAFINKVELPEKSSFKKFRDRFFSIVKSTAEVKEIIKGETDINKSSYVEKTTKLRTAANIGIIASFLEWVGGAAISTFSGIKKVAAFFDGMQGGILGVAAFALGTVLGFTYYNRRVKPDMEEAKKELKKLYDANAWKFDLMEELETENRKLRKLVKGLRPNPENQYNSKIEMLPIMKGADDRAFRRLVPSKKTNSFTYAKKGVNRLSVATGRMGTGILLFRLLPLSILAVAGISLTATVSAIFWPVTIAALVAGAIWAGIFLYKYIEERRIESAKNFINDIDNRIEAEQVANDTYRAQLGLDRKLDRYNQEITKQNEVKMRPNQRITKHNQTIAKQNEIITARNQALADRNKVIQARYAAINERAEAMKAEDNPQTLELNELIAAQGQKITELNETIRQYNIAIYKKELPYEILMTKELPLMPQIPLVTPTSVRQIAELPEVQPKRLKFWEDPKDIRRDTGMEMQYDMPAGLVK